MFNRAVHPGSGDSLHGLDSSDAAASQLRVTAVCVSRNPETWLIPALPFYNHTEGWKPFKHEKTKERIEYLADRRNIAVGRALQSFPDTEHILMIDSYYLHQVDQIIRLLQEYVRIMPTYPDGCILGASSWIHDLTRIRALYRFYDGWTTPEAIRLKLKNVERSGGMMKVSSVGGCYLYPKWVWEKTKYATPEDLHGCEHNWLCEHSELPVFLSLNETLWREPLVYPWLKRVRMSLHIGRFLRRS